MKIIKRLETVKKALVFLSGLFLLVANQSVGVFAQVPTANFTSATTTGCAPLTINFVNQSTQADAYLWDFGNGNTSTLANPTTVYIAPGNFTVTLIAINSLTGNRDTFVAVNYIFVPTDPIADFTIATVTGCVNNDNFSFTNLSVDAVSYIWDFGDGNTSTLENPSHSYSTPGVYTVKLIAVNSMGCTNVKTLTALITVYASPVASFSVNQQSSCDQNQLFSFTATSTGATSWMWDFGDGTTSNIANPTHTYSTQGSYNVTLIVTNTNGCSDTIVQPAFINIGATLVPSFTVNTQTGCPPFAATFNCNVPGATSWLWDFGDGNTSTIENPSHIYASPGSYDITLTVTTTSGCNGSVTMPAFITVDPLPVAQFTVLNPTGCGPHSVPFTNTSTGAVTWLWDFGNGVTSNDTNPVIEFPTSGSYDVTLIVYSANGCTDTSTLSQAVTVNSITAGFTATPRIGCAPLPVDFTSTSTPAAVSWLWDFGDGNTSGLQDPSNVYNSIGNYQVSLIVTSADGCTDTIVRPNYISVVTDSTDYTVPDTIIVCTPPGTVNFVDPTIGSNQWLWNFGDGDTSSTQNPVHTYTVPGTYVVTLATGMAGGCVQLFNPYAIINVMPFVTTPIISIIASPCGPFTVQLDNHSLNVATYLWDFGDGNTSTLQNPVHTYSQAGTYTITLLLTALNGCQISLTSIVTFGHEMPIMISDPDACMGDVITFSLNPSTSFISAFWDFGDGTTSNLLQPTHVYNSVGTFPVTVTITDNNGCVFSFTNPVDIIISNPLPIFTANLPHEGCVPFLVQFNNTSTGATGYSWDFGDGGTSAIANPSHNYTLPGIYPVTLVVTENGCTRSLTIPDLITANQAVAEFTYTPPTGCLPLTVNYTDQSINPVSWFWQFGDGNTSTLQHPVHVFTFDPPVSVTLTIVDINGCSRTRSRSNINPVIPVINVNDSIGCRPLLVNFSTPTTAVTYLWDFGDGNTSSLQNPSHLYTQTGSYTVTLTCILASGCSAITVKPDFISVNAPVADFMSPTVSICAPSLVNFVNQSTGATSWLWHFGDGTTSTNENPAHIYNIPGTYTVSLIAYSAEGCADTLVRLDYIVVPGTFSDFTLASSINCLNNVAQFLDLSINATSWFWNFGDGFTSTDQNPAHLYADTGSYIVTLITSDSTGCSSFYSGSNPIVIHPIPSANASIGNPVGCQPLLVNFTNNSTGSISNIWHFGNGDSSILSNPSYSYTNAGTYTPYLVALNNVGCSDTIDFPGGVVVNPVPIASFIPSSVVGCSPLEVDFINTSNQLSSPSYQWDFGNGLVSILNSPSTVFTIPGIYTVTLIVENTEGCSDTISTNITVNQSPVAQGTVSDTSGCAPYIFNFTENSQFASSILWNFGDGTTGDSTSVQHVYTTPGTYFPYLVAYTTEGCTDTMYFAAPLNVHPVPDAAFSVDQNAACPGSLFQFTNLSSPSSGLSFNWSIAGNLFTTENPSIVINDPGFYDVSLIVTSQFGCIDTTTQTNYIQVFDTLPPQLSPILSVSVLNNTDVEIIWLNNSALDLGAYVLYRRNILTGVYDEIFRDNNPANSVMNVTSNFTDTGLNTLQNVYTYKLQTLDRCAYTLPLAVSIPHTTINITATAVSNSIRVDWTPYIGCQVASYELNRVNLVTGATTFLATLPANTLTYLDPNFQCPHEYSYRVMATDLCGNTFTSFSDTSNAVPENILANQKVEVVRSTVISDRDVLTEWLPPLLSPERVKEYRIVRSLDNVTFSEIAILPSNVFSYIDENANVHANEYYYKIEVISDCEVAGAPSNNSSSIFLQGNHKNEKTKLWWTPYDEWDTGVDYYVIEHLNRIGQWERVKSVQGSQTETILD